MDSERLRMRLNIMKMKDFKTDIVMKSRQVQPFICRVKDFDFSEEDMKVTFIRCEETVFPNDSEEEQNETYTTLIKNIKSVDRHHEKKK